MLLWLVRSLFGICLSFIKRECIQGMHNLQWLWKLSTPTECATQFNWQKWFKHFSIEIMRAIQTRDVTHKLLIKIEKKQLPTKKTCRFFSYCSVNCNWNGNWNVGNWYWNRLNAQHTHCIHIETLFIFLGPLICLFRSNYSSNSKIVSINSYLVGRQKAREKNLIDSIC